MMKRIVVACAMALGLAVTNTAKAETASFAVVADGAPLSLSGLYFLNLQSEGRLQPSKQFMGAVSIMNADLISAAPDTRVELLDEALSVVVSPVLRVKGVIDDSTGKTGGLVAQELVLGGGFSIVKSGLPTSGKRATPIFPGFMTLSDITVDLGTKAIYANVVGDNGVGSIQGLHIWDYQTLTGATNIVMSQCTLGDEPCKPAALEGFELSGLMITDAAFNVMAQSLSMTAFQKSSMAAVSDYGTLTISPVPESSTMALMGIGLIGLVLQARRGRSINLTGEARHG